MRGLGIPRSLCLVATSAGADCDVLRDVIAIEGVNDHERNSSLACKVRFVEATTIHAWFGHHRSSEMPRL
jgi:hypothetical protein